MATHIKLRPLVVHDSASSQSSFNDTCASDSSPSVRAHCALPSTSRGKLIPAPPDTGSAASEDTGVSKLRSKLRRLLGAHSNSSSQGPAVPKGATPSQTAGLRCSSTADLNDRQPPSANGNRSTSSVPVSPNVSGVSGPRGRFHGNGIVIPSSAASTPPATPGGNNASPSVQGSRSGIPAPPSTAAPNPNAPPTPRCPSANNMSRGPSLRRAVSFSPTATTFPPLGSPNVPSPTTGPPMGAANGSARTSISASSSFAATGGRLSNMVVVPEDETLPEDGGPGDYCLSVSAGSIAGPPRAAAVTEFTLRNGRISAADPDSSPSPPAVLSVSAPSVYETTSYSNGGAASSASAAPQLSPSRQAPNGLTDTTTRQRSSSSSSSSTLIVSSGNGYMDVPPAVPPHPLSAPTAAPAAASPATGLVSWSSDASSIHGPFHGAAAASAAALLDASAELPRQVASPQQLTRSQPLKPTRVSGTDNGRPLSSSSSTAGGVAAALPPQRPAVAFHHAPSGSSHAAAVAAPHVHSGGGGGSGGGAQLLNQAPMPPPLTRGMSAFALPMGAGGTASAAGPRSVASPPSPWSTAAGAGPAALTTAHSTAVALPEAPQTPTQQPSGAVDGRAATPTKPPPIRRAHSTIDHATRSQPETPSGPPGVLMALGASLPAEMKRKEWRIEEFTMLKRLYKGNYSAVHKALCRMSMRLVVIKTYDTTRMTELARNHVKREAALHAPLEHDHILNLYAVFAQGPYVMLVEEVAEGGDLYHVLKSIPGHRLQEDRAVAGVLVPLLRSLSYLHEQGICHRDIKLENILFSDRQHTRMLLADFGIALSLRQERAVTRAGTTEYMSPEQLRCPFKRHPSDNKDRTDLHYGLGVDVWATGVLAYELLHGYPPFLGSHREETERLIMTAEVQVAPQLSHGARDFVLSCLSKEPADRPTVMQLLQHPWIRQHMRVLR